METSKKGKQLIIYWFIIFVLIITNIYLNYYISHGDIGFKHKNGILAVFYIIALLFPLISFVLGLLLALIPVKQLSFSVRYFNASTLTLIVIEGSFFLLAFLKLIKG